MAEFVIAIVLSGILNLGSVNAPVVATCTVVSNENNLTIQGDIMCKVVVGGGIDLGITGSVFPLLPTLPDKNRQDLVAY